MLPMMPLELPRNQRGIAYHHPSLDSLIFCSLGDIYIYSPWWDDYWNYIHHISYIIFHVSYIYIYIYRSPLISIIANLYQASICSRMAFQTTFGFVFVGPRIDCRTISVPSMHPYNERRALLRDPMPWHMNDNFTTSNDSYGSLAWNTGRTFFSWRRMRVEPSMVEKFQKCLSC